MAGNATSARQTAERAYNDAKNAGVKGQALSTLKANFDAARSAELSETGQNEQAGYGLNKR